jgi:HD superfamily phosphohydrolase YqeK
MSATRTKQFVAATVLLAIGVLAVSLVVLPRSTQDQFEAAVFFSLAACISQIMAYRLPRGGVGNIVFVPLLSGVAVAPSFPTVLGATTALAFAEYFRKTDRIRGVFNTAQLTVAVGLASLVYIGAGGTPLTSAGFAALAPFIAAFATFFVANAIQFAGVFSISTGERFSDVLMRALGGTSIVYDLIGIPFVFGFAYAYVRVGWVWGGALLVPLLALRLVYKANRELQTVNEELLQLMVASIEARDPYTSGHSQRVAAYSKVVAHTVGLSPRATQRVFTAALLHDVGKIHEEFAPILRKPGRLSDDEFEIMKTHSEKGAKLIAKVTQFADLVAPIRGHHEAWDGSGYPDRLRGTAIPQWARIIAIADTIDAMTTDRPYRKAMAVDEVLVELQRQSGRQFDPAIVRDLVSPRRWPAMAAAIMSERGLVEPGGATTHQPTRLRAEELARA